MNIMKNHECTQEDIDNKRWISRSTSVCFVSVFKIDKNIYVLAGKRGPEVDHPGKWGLLGGYVDYDENLKEACAREFMEETAGLINLRAADLEPWIVDDDPKHEPQNIVHYFFTRKYHRKMQILQDVRNPQLRYRGSSTFTDKNMLDMTNGEIEQVKLINIEELNDYNWAFNHFALIMRFTQSGLL